MIIKKLFNKVYSFGLSAVFWSFLDSKLNSERINVKKHKTILNWLAKRFDYFINEYKNKLQEQHNQITASLPSSPGNKIPKQIWICWWDGDEAMPPIVKACYNSVLKNANDYKVTLITKDNYSDYIEFPEYIMEKVNSRIMTLTHFSNLIRMSLLYKYGGLWLDATILVTGKINLDNFTSFFTVKREYGGEFVTKRRWTGNCIGGMSSFHFYNFVKEFLFEYWKHYNIMIAHLLYDYTIALAYNTFTDIKNIIDTVPYNNKNYMVLTNHLNDEFNQEVFNEITKDTIFHKLSWKKSCEIATPEGKQTFFGYILQNNYIKNI